jgi:hypothetical protein
MSRSLEPDIDARIQRIESLTGKPVVLRPVRPTCHCFRGRVTEKSACFVLEYRDETSGYFWHHDIIRDLLACIEERRGQAITLYDGDVQYVEAPLRRAHKRNHPPRQT